MVWFCSFVLAVWTVAGVAFVLYLISKRMRRRKREGIVD